MQKILVIEDETNIRENLLDLLMIEGFDAIGAENGHRGVQLAKETLPDLIICDVMMSELDGYGVLTQLRDTSSTALIPFIFLTAKGTVEDFRAGLKLGADDYLTKPFKWSDLLDAIAIRLEKQAAIQQFQQEAVQKLNLKIEDLLQANSIKDDFLSTVSHELRGPMTNIKTAVQMLKITTKDERQQQYLDLLQSECSREIDLLNDLLDLQRLEANATPPVVERIHLRNYLLNIVRPFEARMTNNQQSLRIEIAPHIRFIFFDQSDLQRILNELLNNACKYTAPGGKICLSIQGKGPIQITVGNEAEISPEELPRLFERFYRGRVSKHSQEGTGLGLALVKRLVERVDGNIQVTSANGWTQFCIEIPLLNELSVRDQWEN